MAAEPLKRRQVFVDTTPLRTSPDFRRLWIGQSISFIGSQSTLVAGAYQVFHLTHSSLAVGLLGGVRIVPLLVLSLLGGALADAVDRRTMMLRADAALLVTSSLLAVNASLRHPRVWAIYLLVGIATGAARAGPANYVSALFRSTIWNTTIPDALRGRLAGLELANVASGPPLGDLEAGVVASLTSLRFSIVSGGVACLAGCAVLAIALPVFRRYDSRHPHE